MNAMKDIPAIYYLLGIVAMLGRWTIYEPIKYFVELRVLLRTIVGDVSEIKTNHLPHIYDRLGLLEERLETRKDSFGHERRSHSDAGERRPDTD